MAKLDVKAFRGVSDLYIAQMSVAEDGKETYGTPKQLAGVQGITLDVNESQSTYYYDNKASIVIASEGEDSISLTVSRTDLETRALIEGREYDATSKAIFGISKEKPYFALAFRAKLTDGSEELYWFYKGKFTAGSKEFNTIDDGTDVSNMSYTFTAIYTNEEYEYKTGEKAPAKYSVVSNDATVAANWFTAVQTPDLIAGITTV